MGGMMSRVDIVNAINERSLIIYPLDENDESKLTPAGINFSFTSFIVSLNRKMFCKVFSESSDDEDYMNLFFKLEGGDTALALTRESIWVSKSYAGTFHSKVGYVSQGLGHISTTLDPGWMGQLLISVNNPNKNAIKVMIGKKNKKTSEIQYNTFITLCLFKLISPTDKLSDNTNARLDTLCDILDQSTETSPEFRLLMRKVHELNTAISIENLSLTNFNQNSTIMPDDKEKFISSHMKILKKLDSLQSKIEEVTDKIE